MDNQIGWTVHSGTHTEGCRAPQGGKKLKEEEQVILSSHTETYRNKCGQMKPHIKRTMQRQRGFRWASVRGNTQRLKPTCLPPYLRPHKQTHLCIHTDTQTHLWWCWWHGPGVWYRCGPVDSSGLSPVSSQAHILWKTKHTPRQILGQICRLIRYQIISLFIFSPICSPCSSHTSAHSAVAKEPKHATALSFKECRSLTRTFRPWSGFGDHLNNQIYQNQ